MKTIPFSPPDISQLEIDEVVEALRSGWITTGPRVKALEKKIADYVGVGFAGETPRCVCLNSQTACAEMALRILDIGPGDEVIVPAYTYTASAAIVCHVGAKLVLVDSQKNSLEMDYDALEQAITENTKAVIPVDLAGIPCDYPRIAELVAQKAHLFRGNNQVQTALGRIAIVADTAHAFGAQRGGVMCGNIADFSSFSFHAVKNLTTAEGGALTWKAIDGVDDQAIYRQLQLLSLHGQSKDALAKTTVGAWEYDIVAPYYKCNMTDITAAIGLKQLERYPAMLARRQAIIAHYDSVFVPLGLDVLPHMHQDYQSSGHLYIVKVPGISAQQRHEIMVNMAQQGVSCNVHYKPLPMMTAYRNLGFDIANYPNAYAHFEKTITLPLHTNLSDADVAYVAQALTQAVAPYLGD